MDKTDPGPHLSRQLGLFPVTNIVIANMIGAGIFTTSGLLMETLDNPLMMMILWIMGGIIAICGALVYGELGAAMPDAGGEYVFLSKLFHPLAGFLSGWMSFLVGFSAPIAASAIGFSEYFLRAFPSLSGYLSPWAGPSAVSKILSVLIILIFTFVHLRGIRFGALVQNVLTLLKILLIAGLITAGFLFGKGDMSHFSEAKSFSFTFSGWKTIGLSLMWITFAYSGWNASTYIGSEIRNPGRVIPGSLLWGTGIVIVLYLLLNAFFIYALPAGLMKGVVSVGGLAAGSAFGNTAGKIMSLLISFALFSSLSAFILLGPRIYYSMARDGYFFRFAGRIHPDKRTPGLAILLQSFISIVLAVSGTFDQILTYMGFSLGIFPLITVMAGLKLRASGKLTLKLPGYPLTHLVYLVTGVVILVLAYFERPVESTVAVGTLLSGIPAFWLFRKFSGKNADSPTRKEV